MSFSKENINKVVYPKGNSVNVRRFPYASDKVKFKGIPIDNLLINIRKGLPVGRTSGLFFRMKDGDWYQVNLYDKIKDREYGYCRLDVITLVSANNNNNNAEKYGSQLLQDLIKSDIEVYKNILYTSELLDRLKKKGMNVAQYETNIESLIKRYNDRQNAIKDSGLVKTSNWIHEKWKWLQQKFSKDKKVEGVGEIATGVAIAIGAIVALVTASLIYYAFKPRYDDSKADFNESNLYKKAVENLSEADKLKLRADIEKQVDKAYNQGRTDQKFGSIFKTSMTLALVIGGAWLADKFLSKRRQNGQG